MDKYLNSKKRFNEIVQFLESDISNIELKHGKEEHWVEKN